MADASPHTTAFFGRLCCRRQDSGVSPELERSNLTTGPLPQKGLCPQFTLASYRPPRAGRSQAFLLSNTHVSFSSRRILLLGRSPASQEWGRRCTGKPGVRRAGQRKYFSILGRPLQRVALTCALPPLVQCSAFGANRKAAGRFAFGKGNCHCVKILLVSGPPP